MGGKIVLPGFVDAHIHLGEFPGQSTEFAKAVLPPRHHHRHHRPHEIANVMGTDGISICSRPPGPARGRALYAALLRAGHAAGRSPAPTWTTGLSTASMTIPVYRVWPR